MKKKTEKFFRKNPGSSYKNKEVAKKLNIQKPEDYTLLKATLYKLYEEGFLIRRGKRYQLNNLPDSNKFSGTFQIHPDGYGFVSISNDKVGDIFIAERYTGTAFDGDKVEVVLFAKQKGKNLAGQIIKVVKRKRKEVVGTLHRSKSFYFVIPDDFHIHRDIYIDKINLKGAKINDKVIVTNVTWDSTMHNPEGAISKVLGGEGSKDAELEGIAREYNLPLDFSIDALNEADKIKIELPDIELNARLDFRKQITFTIDPDDAKDFDDALSLEMLENGNFKVGVHIADVSHYIPIHSALDEEAQLRGNSVYLVGQVIPMLPEKLSNVICSLVPDKDRLTCSVIFELTKSGKVIKSEIVKSIINSKRRFTYGEVQQILETGQGEFSELLLPLNKLAKTLRKTRVKAGSIEFFTPEVKFELDENGKPVAVQPREMKESNMLVEEFMLLANKTIAENFLNSHSKDGKPFIFRVHDKPEPERIEEFSQFVQMLGYTFYPNSSTDSREFQKLIQQVKGTEEEAVINELAIRSMAKAIYSPKNIGHFGLGFKNYTHFTSPIRRYSDLLVHRMIFSSEGKKTRTFYSLEQVTKICEHISACERTAIAAERQSVKRKQVEFLKDKLGQEFHAVISGVMSFGLFVEIIDILAEGLIRVKDLEGDFYVYDEKKYALIGRRTKKRYRLGDKLTVKLVRADLERLELDFITVD